MTGGYLGLDTNQRCERDFDVVECTGGGIWPTLELSLEARPLRFLGLGAFGALSRNADRDLAHNEVPHEEPYEEQTDLLLRGGLEARFRPFSRLPGSWFGVSTGILRYYGVSEQRAPFVGASLGIDWTPVPMLLLGMGARVEYFILDSASGFLANGTTSYESGVRFWLGARVGVHFGG